MAGPMPKQDSTHQDPEKPKKASKRHLALGVGTLLALIAAYVYKQGGKEELLNVIRETLLSLQSLRNYGALGWVIFVVVFIAQLTVCLPGTMVVDVALGNIYGPLSCLGHQGTLGASWNSDSNLCQVQSWGRQPACWQRQ
ncbi:unnamed protein product [Durusdinium trenchii]|uniref:Uncharacterized protein n=1 Tax=Durusdinium trenchii TaxID=1381693 RepID=A0ABP0SWI9_9DINO